jgi:phosphoribosylformimino-5-aminoimidazole carboxamide ribotide isomerase
MASPRRSLFRPCIDLHDGHVKQIVGGTLSETDPESLKTNFVAKYACETAVVWFKHVAKIVSERETPGDFARLYKLHGLEGGHLIKLGPGNDEAAKEALRAWPGPLEF